jgi:hypothetical protein
LAIAVAGRSTARLVSFLALFWLTGGLLTLRFALAIRPRPGFRLGLAAATAAVVGAGLVLLRGRLSGLVDAEVFVGLLGISAVLTGVLRVLGGFAAEERLGRRWTLGGIVLGTQNCGAAPHLSWRRARQLCHGLLARSCPVARSLQVSCLLR